MIARRWYDRLRFRFLILLGLYLLGVVGVYVYLYYNSYLYYRSRYTDLDLDAAIRDAGVLDAAINNGTTIGVLLPFLSPLGSLALVGLGIGTGRAQSRRTLILCIIGFALAVVLTLAEATPRVMSSGW
jgi:hypothetical protein